MMNSFCSLGIKDTSNIPASSSLGDLGMDSLMGSEIKQTLERSYDIVLTTQEIRGLTFGKLFEYAGSNNQNGEQSLDVNIFHTLLFY